MKKKKALCIGINKYKKSPLRGCVNDARAMRNILVEKFDFEPSEIRLLLDFDATSVGIKKGISDLVANSNQGDSVVFFIACHGTQVGVGIEGEQDRKDEAIVPIDMHYNSLITDNYIYENLVKPFEGKKATLTAIFDCCHSGTILRDLAFDPFTGNPVQNVLNRCLPGWFFDEATETRSLDFAFPVNGLSACRDNETAADLRNAAGTGIAQGAFSYAFQNLIAKNTGLTYGEIESKILEAVKSVSPNHIQNPQMQIVDENRPIFSN